jgi:hypothetical protein
MFHFPTPHTPVPLRGIPRRLLDLSRSMARASQLGRPGADPAEAAYLAEFARQDCELWAVVRNGGSYALLDRAAALGLMRRLNDQGPYSGILSKLSPAAGARLRRRRAEAWLRRKATYFGPRSGLTVLLAARFAQGIDYYDVGPGNLDGRFLAELRGAGAVTVTVRLDDPVLHEGSMPGDAVLTCTDPDHLRLGPACTGYRGHDAGNADKVPA